MPEISLKPVLGVIEGFYGRPWTHTDRLFLLDVLPDLGLDAYLYAPKADASLRRAWMIPRSAQGQAELSELADAALRSGIVFAVGLSPFDLYRAYDRRARAELQARLRDLRACGVRSLALLFDDMPGDLADLAERQAEIATDIRAWLPDVELRVCPTYYSDDPILDRVFGARPAAYLEDLGRLLPEGVPLFWTGPQVCSRELTAAHLRGIRERAQRALALWDNYPVNDSKTRSEHLYLAPLGHRDEVPGVDLDSHWCNAMNQMALSLPALASLAHLHGRATPELDRVFARAGLTDELVRACEPLDTCSRDGLEGITLERLQVASTGATPAARELAAWLAGAYVFDPACLTD